MLHLQTKITEKNLNWHNKQEVLKADV